MLQKPITSEKMDTLTDREILVFNLLVKNQTYSQIAYDLSIPRTSIGYIVSTIYKKLEIKQRRPENLRSVWRWSLHLQKNKRTDDSHLTFWVCWKVQTKLDIFVARKRISLRGYLNATNIFLYSSSKKMLQFEYG